MSEERPTPQAKRDCLRCARTRQLRIGEQTTIVSPRKLAHFAYYEGRTACGCDATSDGWWWPL